MIQNFDNNERKKLIVFPHRLNEDKQPNIFYDLINYLPDDWSYVVTQKKNYTKEQYYEMLASAKIVFSCSLHENLGISQMEGVLSGAIPVMPDRASYPEMYNPIFIYPTEWTENWGAYIEHRQELVDFIVNLMDSYDEIKEEYLKPQSSIIQNVYMSASKMYNLLIKDEHVESIDK